jgi:alkylhydroperoxidase family enzyme
MTWTTWIETVPLDTADETARELYRDRRDMTTGRPPDVVRLTSLTPSVSGLLHDLQQAIHREATGLTLREREIAALIVAVYNGCVH